MDPNLASPTSSMNPNIHETVKGSWQLVCDCLHPSVTKLCFTVLSSYLFIFKFSTSDNAILAFWLVYFILVSSHYTYVWPYMEVNVANVASHNFFLLCGRKPSFVDKKLDRIKTNSVSCLQKKYKKLLTMPSHQQQKSHKFGMRIFNGTYRLSFPLKLQNFKQEHRDFMHSWRLCNNDNFYFNVT